MAIKILKPGLSTTVQDLGRPGYYHLGIPLSGAMDRFALSCANLLVGNDEGAAALECTFMGPELEFTGDATIAVTGAELPAKLNGTLQPGWTSFSVKKGDVLAFDFLKKGARAYVAVSGGVAVPLLLGSRSTYTLGALGGHQGRKLEAGDVLPVGEARGAKAGRAVAEDCRRGPGAQAELRAIPGLYWHRVTEPSGRHFFEDSWKVAPEADRIGYRFRGGRPLDFVPRTPPFVPGGSEPIVLHRDAVSGGGYMMVGTVISADMDLIGQLQPHTATRFVEVDMPAALAARHDRENLLNKVRAALG